MRRFLLFITALGLFAGVPGMGLPVPRTEWAGAYLNGTKVGWSLFSFGHSGNYPPDLTGVVPDRMASHLEDGTPVVVSQAVLQVRAYGLPNRLNWRMVAALRSDLTLANFDFRLESEDSSIQLRGEVSGHTIRVTIESASSRSVQEIPFRVDGVYIAEAIPLLLAEAMKNGEDLEREVVVFEPHQLSCSTWRIRYEGPEELLFPEGPVRVHRIVQEIGGFDPVLWMDEEGRVFKEWAPLSEEFGYLSLRETAEEARDSTFKNPLLESSGTVASSTQPTLDLMDATCVRVAEKIPRSEDVTRMVIDLWNFELHQPIPQGPWQNNLARYPESKPTSEIPLRLEILSPDLEALTGSSDSDTGFPSGRFREYLQEEPLIQVDHPEIEKLAAEIVRDATDPWQKAVSIYRWIEKNIRTEFRITLPSALEVLEKRKGDCNEQSTLFAALARAAGVPTKICTGLVYQDSGFYYHAWNEVLVSADPETWIPIDPALKQIRVDATHIKFGEGGLADQSYLNGLIGKIRARVIEWEKDDRNPEPDQTLRNQGRG